MLSTLNKKLLRIAIAPVIVFLCVITGYSYKFDFVTVNDIVKQIKKTFSDVESYQANFVMVSDKMGKRQTQSGTIWYMSPHYLRIDFDVPYGQKIVSDGKQVWIYIPSINVVAEQDLNSSMFAIGTGSGLNRLFSKYHYKFDGKEQPRVEGNNKYYVLFLKQKETRSGFRTMKLWVNEQYFITKAAGETANGKNITIKIKNINTKVDLKKGFFKFDPPSNARIIKNPMLAEE
ncbi:MAG TPA: outer-membrane lipoprotein carrier protein LolA [Spirochaetota bacterium]|nr:outer-membrane lipoprotein carrier protein LolA [Spirochaetota bacterium]HOM09758.1 outer-membrane lipoprotein carrier protein LolA [Spirochaetota bacterium]HPP49342.1 outer-membrane lipoprotein carrier protein LolA [Spirochaetota bacterium]